MSILTRAPFLPQRLTSVLGIVALALNLTGCAHFLNQGEGDTLSKQDKIKVTQIDTREMNGKLTQTEADLEKDALTHNIKF